MAYHLIAISTKEHRIMDDANNWSDPLPESPHEPTVNAIATTGNLNGIALAPLHPMSPRDIEVASGAGVRTIRSNAT